MFLVKKNIIDANKKYCCNGNSLIEIECQCYSANVRNARKYSKSTCNWYLKSNKVLRALFWSIATETVKRYYSEEIEASIVNSPIVEIEFLFHSTNEFF